jgi:hypothetical protein
MAQSELRMSFDRNDCYYYYYYYRETDEINKENRDIGSYYNPCKFSQG